MRVARIAVPLTLAVALIGGLVASSGLSPDEFVATLREISPAAIAGILTTTVMFLTLSALKWRMVMAQVGSAAEAPPAWSLSIYYTSLGAALSLVIPPHAGMVVSRSIGTKLHSNGSAVASGAASAYEQMFDVVPLATMALAALISFAFKANLAVWLAIAAALNMVALAAMIVALRTRFWTLANLVPLPQRHREPLRQKLEWFATPAAKTLLGATFVTTLFAISLIRYAIVMLRMWLVVTTVNLPVSGFQFLKAFGIARLSSIVSITPGELGISEWTWSGVLAWIGIPLDQGARFVLVNRLCNDASLVAVFGIVWLIFTASIMRRTGARPRHAVRP